MTGAASVCHSSASIASTTCSMAGTQSTRPAGHRQGAGEGACAAHRAPPQPGHRRHLRVAGLVDGDGEPLLLLRGRRRLRAVLPEVLFVLPVQRQAVHQRARVPEAAVDQAGHCVRAARQRHPELRGPRGDAAARRRTDGRQDRRAAAQVAGPAAAPLRGRRPGAGHPLRHLHAASRVRPHRGLRPAGAGTGLLRRGAAREPRHGPSRPSAVDLQPARQPTHPIAVSHPRHHRRGHPSSRRCIWTTNARASSSTTRRGARCAPRRSSTTRTTSMSAAG